MTSFTTDVRTYMSSPVVSVPDGESVRAAEQKLASLGISALAVVDRSGGLIGVLSRTDLLRVGRVRPTNGFRRRVLSLPDVSVREVMAASVEIVTPDTTLAEVARRMVRQHIHRLYVAEDRRPLGVVSTKEMMQAVVDARVALPVSTFMHKSLVVVKASDTLSLALERMALTHHHGLVVIDDGWPVGFFTQADALAAREAPPDEHVEHFMDPRLICVPLAMPIFRAGEQAVATRARRILVLDGAGLAGILSGMDFAQLVRG